MLPGALFFPSPSSAPDNDPSYVSRLLSSADFLPVSPSLSPCNKTLPPYFHRFFCESTGYYPLWIRSMPYFGSFRDVILAFIFSFLGVLSKGVFILVFQFVILCLALLFNFPLFLLFVLTLLLVSFLSLSLPPPPPYSSFFSLLVSLSPLPSASFLFPNPRSFPPSSPSFAADLPPLQGQREPGR